MQHVSQSRWPAAVASAARQPASPYRPLPPTLSQGGAGEQAFQPQRHGEHTNEVGSNCAQMQAGKQAGRQAGGRECR